MRGLTSNSECRNRHEGERCLLPPSRTHFQSFNLRVDRATVVCGAGSLRAPQPARYPGGRSPWWPRGWRPGSAPPGEPVRYPDNLPQTLLRGCGNTGKQHWPNSCSKGSPSQPSSTRPVRPLNMSVADQRRACSTRSSRSISGRSLRRLQPKASTDLVTPLRM